MLPSGTKLRKVSPLANWTTEGVTTYATVHEISLLPLHSKRKTRGKLSCLEHELTEESKLKLG